MPIHHVKGQPADIARHPVEFTRLELVLRSFKSLRLQACQNPGLLDTLWQGHPWKGKQCLKVFVEILIYKDTLGKENNVWRYLLKYWYITGPSFQCPCRTFTFGRRSGLHRCLISRLFRETRCQKQCWRLTSPAILHRRSTNLILTGKDEVGVSCGHTWSQLIPFVTPDRTCHICSPLVTRVISGHPWSYLGFSSRTWSQLLMSGHIWSFLVKSVTSARIWPTSSSMITSDDICSHLSHLVATVTPGHVWSHLFSTVTPDHVWSHLVISVKCAHVWVKSVTSFHALSPYMLTYLAYFSEIQLVYEFWPRFWSSQGTWMSVLKIKVGNCSRE